MFFTGMGALRENAMDDAASPTSSPSDSVSQTYSYKQQKENFIYGKQIKRCKRRRVNLRNSKKKALTQFIKVSSQNQPSCKKNWENVESFFEGSDLGILKACCIPKEPLVLCYSPGTLFLRTKPPLNV